MEQLVSSIKRLKYRLEGRYRPSIQRKCSYDFIGTDYGGYALCPTILPARPLIYSFGVGEDISFDVGVIQKFNARVFAFDPTPKSHQWLMLQELPADFVWYDFGLFHEDGTITFYPPEKAAHVSHSSVRRAARHLNGIELPVRRLASIAAMLGHDKIDVLKMDIEGAEYSVIPDMLRAPTVTVDQILVEFHHRFLENGVERTKQTIELLNGYGLELFWVSPRADVFSFIRTQRLDNMGSE